MTRYLISFDQGAMDHIPDEEEPAVGEAAHEVSQEAMDAGVFVFAGGFTEDVSVVATDGTVTDAPKSKPQIGGGNDRRRALPRGRAGVGCQDRRRLPLCSGVPRDPARPGGGQLIRSLAWPTVRTRRAVGRPGLSPRPGSQPLPCCPMRHHYMSFARQPMKSNGLSLPSSILRAVSRRRRDVGSAACSVRLTASSRRRISPDHSCSP